MQISREWNDEKDEAGNDVVFKESTKMRLVNWKSLAVRHEFEYIRKFVMRTLSVSPLSCAAERSFSMKGRIRTKARNRLDTDKLMNLEFTHCNMVLLGDAQLWKAEVWRSVDGSDDRETEDSGNTEEEQRWDTDSGAATRSMFEDVDDLESDRIGVSERNLHTRVITTSPINRLGTGSGTRQRS